MSSLGDRFKVNFEGTLTSGDLCMITRAIRHQSGADVVNSVVAAALASQFASAYTNINTAQPVGVSWDVVRMFSIDPVTAEMNEVATATISGAVGTGTGDQLPNQSAALVQVRANPPRRSGRFFVPGFNEGQQADDTWSTSFLSTLLTFATELLADMVVSGVATFDFGTWSRSLNQFFPDLGNFAVTGIKSQRRRQSGVGE